jgi:hypothetical protein
MHGSTLVAWRPQLLLWMCELLWFETMVSHGGHMAWLLTELSVQLSHVHISHVTAGNFQLERKL